MSGAHPGTAFIIGMVSCWGSKVGLYHSLCLPVILIEMEVGAPSLWGAMDEATLVLVSAGICSASNLLIPSARQTAEMTELCRRAGLRTNLFFGDFIEAAHFLYGTQPRDQHWRILPCKWRGSGTFEWKLDQRHDHGPCPSAGISAPCRGLEKD